MKFSYGTFAVSGRNASPQIGAANPEPDAS
jgi:hypothetical protein